MTRIVSLVVVMFAAILPACAQSRGMVSARGGMAPARMGVHTASGFAPRGVAGFTPRVVTGARGTFGFSAVPRPLLRNGSPVFFGRSFFRPRVGPFCRFGGVGCRFRYGAFWPSAFWASSYYPWGWGWNSGDYDSDNSDLQNALIQQQQINAELQNELNDQQMQAYQDAQARPPAPAPTAKAEPASPPTVLVFRDGSRQEIQNYALVGDTLYEFSGSNTRKIQIAQLDVPATVRENDSRGVEFRLPSAR